MAKATISKAIGISIILTKEHLDSIMNLLKEDAKEKILIEVKVEG